MTSTSLHLMILFQLCSSFLCLKSDLIFSPDYVKGFGGKFGVQTDRVDKSAVGWDHQEKLQLHESQKGNTPSLIYVSKRKETVLKGRT